MRCGLQGLTRPDLIVIIDRLLLFIGEEKASGVTIRKALLDIRTKMSEGLPPLFYQGIPYMPVYAAAGDEIQFGFVLADGEVRAALHQVPYK